MTHDQPETLGAERLEPHVMQAFPATVHRSPHGTVLSVQTKKGNQSLRSSVPLSLPFVYQRPIFKLFIHQGGHSPQLIVRCGPSGYRNVSCFVRTLV